MIVPLDCLRFWFLEYHDAIGIRPVSSVGFDGLRGEKEHFFEVVYVCEGSQESWMDRPREFREGVYRARDAYWGCCRRTREVLCALYGPPCARTDDRERWGELAPLATMVRATKELRSVPIEGRRWFEIMREQMDAMRLDAEAEFADRVRDLP